MSRVIPAFSQFFGSDGEPLANGWLRFLISGTNNTAKNTYADADQMIPNPNPLQLDGEGRAPNIFGQGIYRVVLFENNVVLHQPGELIQMFDPVVADYLPEGAGGNFAEWDSEVIYQIGQIVLFNEFYYRSVTANNIGNQPDLQTDDWERIEFLRFWNLDVTYKQNDVVIYGSQLFTSIMDANLNHNPASSPAWWYTVGPNQILYDTFVISEDQWRTSDAAGTSVILGADITLTADFIPISPVNTNGYEIDGAFTLSFEDRQPNLLTDNCFGPLLTVTGLTTARPSYWGVTADSQTVSDAVAAIGDNTLTSASNPWTIADVGKLILVEGAGASGDTLITTIAAYNGPGSIELTDAPTSDPTGTDNGAQWGTDNTTAIQSAIDSTIIGNVIIDRGILYNFTAITGISGTTVSITDYSRTGDWDEGLQIQNHLGVIGDIDLSPVGSGNPELTFKMRRGGYGKLYDQAIISTNPTTQQFMIKFPNAAGTMVDIINFLTNTNTPNLTFKYPIYLDRGPTSNCSINFNSSGAGNSYIEWNHSNNEMRYYVRNSGDTAWVLVHRDSNSRKTIDLETHLNRSSGNIALYFDENGTSRAFTEYNTSNNEMRFYIRNAANSAWVEAFGVSGEDDNPAMIWPKLSAVPAAAPANSIKTYSRDAGPGVRMMAQNASGTELTFHLCVSNETQMRAADSAGISIVLGANITLTSDFTPSVPINTNGYQISGAYAFTPSNEFIGTNGCFGSSLLEDLSLAKISSAISFDWWSPAGDDSTDDAAKFIRFLNASAYRYAILGPNKTYKIVGNGYGNLSTGTTLDLNRSTIKFYLTNNQKAFYLNNYCTIENGIVKVVSSGTPTGKYQFPILIGDADTNEGFHDIVLRNLEIDSSRADANGGMIQLFGNTYNVLIENITFPDNANIGYAFGLSDGGGSAYFTGGVWDGAGAGYVYYPHDVIARNIKIGELSASGATGFYPGAGYNILVENVEVQRMDVGTKMNVAVFPPVSVVDFQRNMLCKNVIVRNCAFIEIKQKGAWINGQQNTAFGASQGDWEVAYTFENNRVLCDITDVNSYPLYLQYLDGSKIINNTLEGGYVRGIGIDKSVRYCDISGNTIKNIGGSGIEEVQGSTGTIYNKIAFNRIEDCNINNNVDLWRTCLIYLRGDFNYIGYNKLGDDSSEGAKYGIYLPSGADNNHLEYNRVRNLKTGATYNNYYVASSECVLNWNFGHGSHTYLAGSTGNIKYNRINDTFQTITGASVNLSNGNFFVTNNGGATTLSVISGMIVGQPKVIKFGDNNTTVDFTGTNLKGNAGADWTPAVGDFMTVVYDGTNYYCTITDTTA